MLPPPPSTQSQASGLRALALGGIWEVHLRLLAVVSALRFVAKNHLHFDRPKSRKNEGFGRPKRLPKFIFSSFGGYRFQTLIFQAFSSISLAWAWELLLRIFNICSSKHCKNLGFLQVFVGFRPNARFRGWHQNPSFGGP